MYAIIIVASILLFVSILFGALYLAAKSQGFVVPDYYVSPEVILNFPLTENVEYPDKHIETISGDMENVRIEGNYEGKMLKFTVENKRVIVAAIYWNNEKNALRFWKRYYRSVYRQGVRRNAFRNTLWKPKFIVGRYGKNARLDISAWYQDKWFFLVATSTQIKNYNEIKVKLKNRLNEHIKRLSVKKNFR